MINRFSSFRRCFMFPLSGLFFVFILFGPIVAQSATYYVSLTGSDSNPGTLSQPFKTFAKAVKPLRPGDTLYIRGGLWTTQLDLQANNTTGTSAGWIKIAGYPGETVTIRYADPLSADYGPIKARGTRGYLTFENLVLDGINSANKTAFQIVSGNHHIILRNLEIKNWRFNGLFISANDVQVINCTIHDQISVSGASGERWYGIYFHDGANGLIQGNKIYRNPGGGIQAYPGPISNLIIRGNAVYNNNTLASATVGGILVWGQSSSKISNTQIYNNLVYKNGNVSSSGSATGITIGYYTSGTKVWHNTVYGNNRFGILNGYDTTTSSTTIQNNISYGNTSGNYTGKGTSTTYTNNVTTDPGFIDAASSNFALKSTSSAVNTGVRLSSVTVDYKNAPRPKGITSDVGGFENY